jgi:hypothetical protein
LRLGKVILDFHAEYPENVILIAGITLSPTDKKSDWPGWVWCVHDSGVECWVPQVFLDLRGEKTLLVKDYNAKELTVTVGQQIALEDSVAGWYWCLNQAGEEGWVPQKHIEIIIE